VWRGRAWGGFPGILVADDADVVAIYLPPHTRYWSVAGPRESYLERVLAGDWELEERTWGPPGNWTLWVTPTEAAHSVAMFWWPSGDLQAWYVNLQEPLTRTRFGFDTCDHVLDIVVAPDLSTWEWKDEAEFAHAQAIGLLSGDQARAIRQEGERVIDRIEQRQSPFDGSWLEWKPDRNWVSRELPADWKRV
jgi:predicted RNA-binding protein associated with RNAse of E/G family